MRKQLPSISESPTDLCRRLKAEKEGKKRQRLQALYLLASGQARSRLALATLLAVHRHTIKAWLDLYEGGGVTGLLRIKKAPGKVPSFSPPVLSALQQRLEQPQGFASYREIQHYLAHEHQVHLAYSSVHALVRYKLQAKHKSPRRSHPKKSLRR